MDHHCRDRLQWADRHINWTRQDWPTVLFSDESRFALSNSDGRIRVYQRRVNVTLTVVFSSGGDSVMVWAGIGYGYHTQLVVIDGNLNAQKYGDHVLALHIVPLLQNHDVISLFGKTTPDLTSPLTISSSCKTTTLSS